jgi:hypothetical protein
VSHHVFYRDIKYVTGVSSTDQESQGEQNNQETGEPEMSARGGVLLNAPVCVVMPIIYRQTYQQIYLSSLA